MSLRKSKILSKLFVPSVVALLVFLLPHAAYAKWAIVDKFNLSPFVPIVLDALMAVATGGYDFFVGKGNGVIYLFIWGFLVITISLYLLKLYFPERWVSFFGFSPGEHISDVNAGKIATGLLKPAIRAIIAATILLQIRPAFVTEWLVNPFLEFGSLYTHAITDSLKRTGIVSQKVSCPPDVIQQGWISKESCEFLVQPVYDISNANNQVIKRGFEFITRGLHGLITLVPHGGEDFLNVITGILLVCTFVASNLFMALLIIQAIFYFGMALILYPFQVLTYVVKSSDKWFDVWPAFSGITKSLQKLIITMIACAFILAINIAIIKSLFQWNSSVFVVSAHGAVSSNVPQVASGALGFGQHSILWLSSILTFYLLFRIFALTRDQINTYAGENKLYNKVIKDTKTLWGGAKKWGSTIKMATGLAKKE